MKILVSRILARIAVREMREMREMGKQKFTVCQTIIETTLAPICGQTVRIRKKSAFYFFLGHQKLHRAMLLYLF